MAKVLILSDRFPSSHPKKSHPTNFLDMFLNGLKENGVFDEEYINTQFERIYSDTLFRHYRGWVEDSYTRSKKTKLHTIRNGTNRKLGEMLSPRLWYNLPYKKPGTVVICDDLPIRQLYGIHIQKIVNTLKVEITGTSKSLNFEVLINIPKWQGEYGINTMEMTSQSLYRTGEPLFDKLCSLDGLNQIDLHNWFIPIKKIRGKSNVNNHFEFRGQIISFIDSDFYGLNV